MRKIFFPLFLALAMLVNTVSSTAASDPSYTTDNLIELTDKRDQYSRHFLKEDGTVEAYSYPEPVNYLKDGQWIQIDNTLEKTEGSYRNKSNEFSVEFAENARKENLVTLAKDKYEVYWSIRTGDSQIPNGIAEIGKNNPDISFPLSVTTSSSILYPEIFEGTDIKYTVSSTRIREDIILNSPAAVSEFQFDITCDGLTAKLEDDRTVSFTDPEKPEEIVFLMEAPFMYDSSESSDISYDIEVFLTETKFGYSLAYKPYKTWLDSPERVYPVVIDPTTSVYSTRSSSAIADTYVHSGDSSGDHTLLSYLRIGNAPDGLTRTFIKTDLPTITGGTVYRAKLLLSNTGGSSTFQNVNVYRMNSSWTSSGISWSSHLSLLKTLIASNVPVSAYSNSPSAHRYVCDVTNTVQDFYKGTRTNYGFMVRYTDDSIADYNAFYSSDCGTTNVMPCLYISYVYGETSGITSGEIYYIKNMNSGQYLDVEGAGVSNGTGIIQWPYSGAINQKWKISYAGSGLYRLIPQNIQSKYLSVDSYTNQNGIAIEINSGDLSTQYWSILSNGNGSYRILSECSNLTKGLTVEGASCDPGKDVIQYSYTGSGSLTNDDWVFFDAGLSNNMVFYFYNASSSRHVEVHESSLTENAQINQNMLTQESNQKWRFERQENGYYKIYPMHTNNRVLRLDTDNNIVSGNNTTTDRTLWELLPLSSIRYRIRSKYDSTKYITVTDNYSLTNLIGAAANGAYSEWYIYEFVNNSYWDGDYTIASDVSYVYFNTQANAINEYMTNSVYASGEA